MRSPRSLDCGVRRSLTARDSGLGEAAIAHGGAGTVVVLAIRLVRVRAVPVVDCAYGR